MKPGSAQADYAYEKARDKAADAYWAVHETCPWCNCTSSDVETCTECGESMICPECGKTDLQWNGVLADQAGAAGCDTDWRECKDCGHKWDFQ